MTQNKIHCVFFKIERLTKNRGSRALRRVVEVVVVVVDDADIDGSVVVDVVEVVVVDVDVDVVVVVVVVVVLSTAINAASFVGGDARTRC